MIKIGTHNGPFHADDAMAVAILSMVFDYDVEVVRTRDPDILATCDILVDVGGIDDPSKGRFDHHQRGGAGARPNGVPYSSAGLVWKKYGGEIPLIDRKMNGKVGSADFDTEIARLVDVSLIQSIDALDCGYGTRMISEGVEHSTFSDQISALNPTFLEPSSPAHFDARFERAVENAAEALERAIALAVATVHARKLVEGQTGETVVIDRYAPVMDILASDFPDAKYLIYPSPGGEWMVQCVPPVVGSFAQRRPLPEAWAGLRDAALDAVTGIDGCVFAHIGRFICGAKTREGALALAKLALA